MKQVIEMNQDTQDFLGTLLWIVDDPDRGNNEVKGTSLLDCSPEIIEAVAGFISGFKQYLEKQGFDLSRLGNLKRSFGGNVYFSLSGHGCGFFDEYGNVSKSGVKDETLGDDLQRLIGAYSGNRYRFEELEHLLTMNEQGKIDLAFLPAFLDEQRTKMFKV